MVVQVDKALKMIGGTLPTPPEVREAVAAVTRSNQASPTWEEDWTVPTLIEDMDCDSTFTTEVCDTQNINTNICDICCNFDDTAGTTQLEEANLTYMSKVQAI